MIAWQILKGCCYLVALFLVPAALMAALLAWSLFVVVGLVMVGILFVCDWIGHTLDETRELHAHETRLAEVRDAS